MIIRRLSPKDVVDYRRLRLRGLRENPEAFGSAYSEEVKRPVKMFVQRLKWTADRWTFGAFEGERLVGVVTLMRDSGQKQRHKASILGMYVHTKMRRKGIGRALLSRIIETAVQLRGLRQLKISVVEENRPAERLYKSVGFRVYGREEDALFVRGRFYAELFLIRTLIKGH